jgi:hypothetical protein
VRPRIRPVLRVELAEFPDRGQRLPGNIGEELKEVRTITQTEGRDAVANTEL